MQNIYPRHPIMVVDDEPIILASTKRILKSTGHNNVILCDDSREVIEILSNQRVNLILLDLLMPHIHGEELLDAISETFPEVCIIIVTGVNDVDTAVRCVRGHAFDYLVKPVEENRLITTITRALDSIELNTVAASLKNQVMSDIPGYNKSFADIVTRNAAMISIFNYLEAVSSSDKPLLFTGETGVGKELLARTVHKLSGREGDFVVAEIGGLDENELLSTLFGNVKDPNTGVRGNQAGLIYKASAGTLFLDEIGNLKISTQIHILRLIQQREFFPVGSNIPNRTNARIMLATNQNIEDRLKVGKFRKDLFFRIKTHQINVPPLRERLEDLPLLLDHFIEKSVQFLERDKPNYPDELLPLLASYYFPGNVRELEEIVYDAVASHETRLLNMAVFKKQIQTERQLFQEAGFRAWENNNPFTSWNRLPPMKQLSSMLVEESLKRTEGNRTLAAEMLGVSRQTITNYLKENQNT